MPSKSRAQQRLFQAALHGADFQKAKRLRRMMPSAELRKFAKGIESEHGGYDFRSRNNLKQNRGR